MPTLLGPGVTGREQEQHDYLYWEDPKSAAVRMGSWKAIKPRKDSGFELYDLSNDIQEQNNVAQQHPDVLSKMMAFAKRAHTPPRHGKVLDESVGFKGHMKD
ncbi:MAG: hypothetical protein HN341_04420 [Verrucomicrobia bacterium]|nr:hypothetical protein [Verrucomicrobiota bacterium]